jgi:hypothetical protein
MVEMENESIPGRSPGKEDEDSVEKKSTFKEDKAKHNEENNTLKRAKKDMENLDKVMAKELKAKATTVQKDIDSSRSDEGWSVLAALTDELGKLNKEINKKELRWMELAEILEEAEVEA